jgi:hypothetical protein
MERCALRPMAVLSRRAGRHVLCPKMFWNSCLSRSYIPKTASALKNVGIGPSERDNFCPFGHDINSLMFGLAWLTATGQSDGISAILLIVEMVTARERFGARKAPRVYGDTREVVSRGAR